MQRVAQTQMKAAVKKQNPIHMALLMALVVMAGTLTTQCGRFKSQSVPETAGFKEFDEHVEEYRKLHKDAEKSSSKMKETNHQDQIAAQQEALVNKIREMRSGARRGDIFTPDAARAIEVAIKAVYSGPDAHRVRNTINAGEPLEGFKVEVNQRYPDSLPFTTMPPTLLQNLPKLPEEVAYRILGSTLLLVDSKANLIVDFMPNAIP